MRTLSGTIWIALLIAAPAAVQAAEPMVSAGEQVARRNCAGCHATQPGKRSLLPDAPTFSELRARYDREQMAAILDNRMHEIHPRMPKLALDGDEVSEFLAWWDGLEPPRTPRR